MKKTIISLALASIAIFGTSSVFAQEKKDKKDNKKTENREQRKLERPQAVNPFEGLNLTEQQQTALKSLAEEQKAEMNKNREADKADRQKEMKNRKEEMSKARQNYLAKIKEILTPEQYCQFLENNYLRQGGKGPSAKGITGKKGNKHYGSKDGKSMRGSKKDNRSGKRNMKAEKQA